MSRWREVVIGDVCDVIAGQSPKGEYYNDDGEGLPFYQGKKAFGEKYLGPPDKWTTQVTREAVDGDILMSVRAPVGPINFVTEIICIGRGLAALSPNDLTELDRDFLYYTLLEKQDEIKGTEGAVYPSINKSQIQCIEMRCPPLPEQERIVAILDEAFAAIETATANAEKNLANARELIESAYYSIVRTAEKPDWRTVTVNDLVAKRKGSIRTGPFGSQLLHREFVDRGIAVLGIDNAVSNEFAWGQRRFISPTKYEDLKRFKVFAGDVIITIMGTCGRCAVVPDDVPEAITSKHLCCISLDTQLCLPAYLQYHFLYHPDSQKHLAKHAKGAIMTGLNMGIIKKLPVHLPPLEEQNTIVRQYADMTEKTMTMNQAYLARLALLSKLKQSILHKAFIGELTADLKAVDRELSEAAV